MREQTNSRVVSKSAAKRTTTSKPSKSFGKMTAQKKAANIVSIRKSKSDSIYSYKSADDKNVLAIIDAVRTGISFNHFQKIVNDLPFSLAEWANYLQLSERTIQRNQKEKKPFQPIQSERIVELIMLYQYGVEVFGNKENFNVWLNSVSIALGGRTPKELLDTKFGVGMVKDELGRIEHGVLA